MFKTLRGLLDRRTYEEREAPAASNRWATINAEARATGCKCGQPATHVRRLPYVIGSVPAEIWTCEEHINVNSWHGRDDGTYVPNPNDAGFSAPSMAQWSGYVTRA